MKRCPSNQEGMPICYLVATPIGNKSELSPRAIEVLSSVAVVGCEDTRNTGALFASFSIHTKRISCHEHNEEEASTLLLSYLKRGESIAYVSDAGYPGISDPGRRLVARCIEEGFAVSVISGSNAMLTALVGSGLDTNHFYFHGFLPGKESERVKELSQLREKKETMIFYESPHRIKETLQNMYDVFGHRSAVIARELTKKFEEYIRGDLEEFVELPKETLLGEMVIVVEGNHETISHFEEAFSYMEELHEEGIQVKLCAKIAAERFLENKNELYREWSKRKNS